MNLPFPTEFAYSPAQLRRQFGVMQDDTRPDPAIHYKLIIPLVWRQLAVTPLVIDEQTPFGPIGAYGSAANPAYKATISVALIKHEIAPSDWLSVYADQLGERVVEQRHTQTAGGAVPDVLTLSADQKTVSRWVVIKNALDRGGAYLHVLRGAIPVADYTSETANQLFVLIANFDYLHPNQWACAERLRTLSRAKPIDFLIAYPESWQVVENPAGSGRFYEAQLTKRLNGREVSRITLATISQTTEPDMKRIPDLFLDGYKKQGIRFGPVNFGQSPQTYLDRAWLAQVNQLPADADTLSPSTLTMLISQKGTNWLYVEQHTQSRETAPDAWAVGKRAFEIVLDNLKAL